MNMRQVLITLIVGCALGVAGAAFLPGIVRPYLPDPLAGKRMVVKGVVAAKEKKAAALLLTVNTDQGAILATITRKVDEAGLLVGVGDAVELRIREYQPFIEDPTVLRVVKSGQPSGGPEVALAPLSSGQTGTEAKPHRAGRPASSAPAKKGSGQSREGKWTKPRGSGRSSKV